MMDIYFFIVVKFHYVIDVATAFDKFKKFWRQTHIYCQFSILSSVFSFTKKYS